MLPTKIQPYIINVTNLSPTTAFPVTLLDAYNTLSPAYNTQYYFSWTITIISSTPPNQIFQFSYIDINAVVQYFSLDGTIFGDSFTYIGTYAPTIVSEGTLPYSLNYGVVFINPQPTIPPNTPASYQNNQNIVINMNPNMNSTYQEFLEATMTNPFDIGKMFFSTNNGEQIEDSIAINIFNKDVDGNDYQKVFEPFINPYQASLEGVIIENKQVIDGFTGIEITSLLPSTSVELYLYPQKRAKQKLSKNKKFIETTENKLALKQKNLFEKNKRFKKYIAEKEIELSLIKDESIVVGKRVKLLSEIKKFAENTDNQLFYKKNSLKEFNDFVKQANRRTNKKVIENSQNQLPHKKENRLKQFNEFLENIKKKLD
jgi:hypothetical protein